MPEIECRLSLRHADFIMQNHRVHGVSVMPGVTFLDIVYRILIAKGFDHRRAELHNVLFTEAVATADGLDREIRVLVGPEEDGVRQVTGESRQAGGDDSSWRRNFSAELRFAAWARARAARSRRRQGEGHDPPRHRRAVRTGPRRADRARRPHALPGPAVPGGRRTAGRAGPGERGTRPREGLPPAPGGTRRGLHRGLRPAAVAGRPVHSRLHRALPRSPAAARPVSRPRAVARGVRDLGRRGPQRLLPVRRGGPARRRVPQAHLQADPSSRADHEAGGRRARSGRSVRRDGRPGR